MTTKERLVEKTMKDMLETLSGVEKYVLVEKIVDLQQRIDKAVEYIKDKDNYNELTDYGYIDKKEVVDKLIDILRGDE